MDSWPILIMAKNVGVCVGIAKGIQEQTLQLGFEGFRHLNVFDNPVSHLLWRKCLLQLLNSLLQRNTPSPSTNPAWALTKNISKIPFWIHYPSIRHCVVLPSLEVVGNKQTNKILCKLNYSWLENIMRFDPISTGLQVSCRWYILLDKSHPMHHSTAW